MIIGCRGPDQHLNQIALCESEVRGGGIKEIAIRIEQPFANGKAIADFISAYPRTSHLSGQEQISITVM